MTQNMFRKVGLLFLAASIVTMTASAQIEFGLKAGLNVAELNTSNSQFATIGGTSQSIRNFPRVLFSGGGLVNIPLNKKFSLQPELIFSMQGANGNPQAGYTFNATETYKLSYINVPVMLQYNLPIGFLIETGPQLGYLISAHIAEDGVGSTSTTNYNVKSQFKSVDLGWGLGVGYLAPFNVGLDVRYTLSLASINDATAAGMASAPVQNGSIKNSVLQMGVYYLFGKPRHPAVQEQ